MVNVVFGAVRCLGDDLVMHRKHDLVARSLDQRHVRGHHVAGDGLAQVLKELAAVGVDAGPLARELVHAHVGDAAVLHDLGVGVAQRAARGQRDQQPTLCGLDLQAQRGVGLATGVQGLHHRVLEPAPVARDVGMSVAPRAL